ncbi:flagellar biosynthesis anti-sigma factor FlgM [Thiogranum longum]|jgi:negative regulator of flagellin synthesis FlgM
MEIENSRIASLVPQSSGQGAAVGNQEHRGAEASSGDSGSTNSTADRVSLTSDARQLQQLESRIASEPVVDNQRVETVRNAVENGTFAVNSERIADKLLSIEQALTDAR